MLGINHLAGFGAGGLGPPSPSSWTFTVSSTYGTYTGHTGVQTKMSGGLASGGSDNSGSEVWGSLSTGSEQFIRADFGAVALVANVYIKAIPSSFESWGPIYTNGASIQVSNDGSAWTTVATTAGHDNSNTLSYAINTEARYVRLHAGIGYLGVSRFYFD